MLRTRHLVGAITAALLYSATAAAANFSQVIVFGDSLSDDGNISLATAPTVQPPLRFTTNPGTLGIEHVASHFGFTLQPSLLGGTDFAWGGAGVLTNSPGTPAAVPTLTSQVGAYLAGGTVDSHALYSIWGGANDIFYAATSAGAAATAQQLIAQNIAAQIAQLQGAGLPQVQIDALLPQITQAVTAAVTQQVQAAAGVSSLMTAEQAQAAIGAAAQQEVKLIGQLQAAGVKNILVFNLPNIGTTPSATAQGPAGAAALTGLSLIFNGQLNAGLAQMQTGIIPVDAYGLLSEAIANPSAYGFSNVTDPACGAGATSVACGPQGSGLPFTYAPGTDQSYLFADGVHPTTATHAMLGDYVMSIIRAPEQISLLGEAPLASSGAQARAVRRQMLLDSKAGETRAFVNIDYARQTFDGSSSSPRTTSDNFNFTLGADVRATDSLAVGIALGAGQNTADFAGGGGYKMQDISGLGYLTYHVGGGYIGGYANFGQSNFKDIERRFAIGAMQRTETGKTDGTHLGGGITGGWWFDFNELSTGPFVTVAWDTAKVSGYHEGGNDSSAMWFGRQQRDALVSTLGWRLQGHWQTGNMVMSPYAELAWNRDSKADPRAVSAGLNSMNGTFALTGFVPDKSWGTAELGLSAQLTPTINSWVGYSGRFSDNSQKYNSVNMGFRFVF
ncbi:MAG TPA: autotransporter domain-containing protein [Rhodanobacter sp.]|nr:autotransporter domain-containing protein [Rhodanobacter sp.]